MFEAQKPIHMIDPAAGVGDFVLVFDVAIACDQIERRLHAVT